MHNHLGTLSSPCQWGCAIVLNPGRSGFEGRHCKLLVYQQTVSNVVNQTKQTSQLTNNINRRCYVKAYTITKYERKAVKQFTNVSIEG